MKKYPEIALVPDEIREELDFLGYIYCPGKEAFSERISGFLESQKQKGIDIKGIVPMGSCAKDEYFNINKIKDINKFPGVLTSCGFTEFFEEDFVKRFVDLEYFDCIEYAGKVSDAYKGLELKDPRNTYNIFAAFPYVLLVDERKLNGRKMPKGWEDILSKDFNNSIAVGHTDEDINEIVLLYLYKNYGDDGIRAFASNINQTMETIEMAKYAASVQKSDIAIYIMPYFFAKAVPKRDFLKIIWPKEGGLLCPVYFMAKKNRKKYLDKITEYLYSKELGQAIADKYFVHINGGVDNKLDSEERLQWLGWDFIYEKNIIARVREIEDVFYDAWRKDSVK